MKQYRDRRKAFIGAVVGAGLGVAKGIAGIVSKKKQAEKQTQQNYVNAILQSKGGMDDEINNNEALQEQFESKYVMKCGGRKRACYGKASKMACGGKRKKAELGALTPLQAPKISTSPTNSIGSLNKDLQAQVGNVGKMNSSSMATSPLPTGGQAQSNFSTVGDISNTAGKIEAGLAGLMNGLSAIGGATGKFKCGGRRKGLAGLSMGMQAGNMVGEIGKAFVKGPSQTAANQISIRKQGLTNLNQPGTNDAQMPNAGNTVVTANTNSAAPISTLPLSNSADANMKAKFGTSRRRCGLGVSISINNTRKK